MTPERIELHGKCFRLYIRRQEITRMVRRLAREIARDYADKDPLCLIVLKGAFIFAADLLRLLPPQWAVETVRARSYGMQMTSSGNVELELPTLPLQGKHLLLIEDIIDTGLTLQALVSALEQHNPASLRIVTLLAKPPARMLPIPLHYVGKEIPPVFVVGYGMDYAEAGRSLPNIYALDSEPQGQS